VCFSDGRERTTLPIPWGDLATAWRSTGIPNITTYMAFPTRFLGGTRRLAPAGQKALSIKPIRRLAQKTAEWLVKGPDKRARRTGRSLIWARAADEAGNGVEAWMETMESYQFTAVAGVRCLEKVLEQGLAGAFTPAQAFGSDFVLEIEGTKRYDDLG
jgi:short subunit dehydrogenase-like uncharacterized protein